MTKQLETLIARELLALREAQTELISKIRFAHDTLIEINPNNYTHDDVCEINAASVEVILSLAPVLGENHGKTEQWWSERESPQLPAVPDEREAFESFMVQRFGESIDQRRAKNGDKEYMAWDKAVAWIVWQHRAAIAAAPKPEVK